jgi:uncharacterized protein YjbI with pentapeptide repeats
MRLPAWLGVGERRWQKSPDEEVQPSKTAWDVLQLLIVPVILVAIALAFNAALASRQEKQENRRVREDRALAKEEREDAVLDAYLDKMSSLMLDRGLVRAKPNSAVREVARTLTLATVRRLDGSRKGQVVRFLYEGGLLRVRRDADGEWSRPVINLYRADLRGADLANSAFGQVLPSNYGVELVGDLRGASFDHALLGSVLFSSTDGSRLSDLRGASFRKASIHGTRFDVDLRGASFERALLEDDDFNHSDLRRTEFDGADILAVTTFDGTCLSNASFVGAKFNWFFGSPERGKRTTFDYAEGRDVDFSNAVNLSAVRLGQEVTNARFAGAKERPGRSPRQDVPSHACAHVALRLSP